MARFFYRYLPKKALNEAEQALQEAKQLMQLPSKNYDHNQVQSLLHLIDERAAAFRRQIERFKKPSHQQPYINSFYAFAKTLKDYFETPGMTDPLSRYHNSGLYCYVGENPDLSYSFADTASSAFFYGGLGLLVLSLFLIPVNLPAALITLGVALSFLFPSAYYSFCITRPNEAAVFKKEEELFNAAIAVATGTPSRSANEEFELEEHLKVQ
ncbi:hypothetical protein [Legionella maceachernii]|uniref:23, 7 kDa protein n=2 Tax=Legionella TaxID=445 RepID=A0A0W0WBU1_9GAMM|nr:hypothetical protein [Legionella maceachernii]KTD29815.1 hypothetical protein Lmac_0759 [Legionella maceachernii]SJZ78839.1 hypothetical protein SAMN02745128_01073 [Legionella maceachernii]SUP02947.1 Uncharacterised protein [Legionella maceachernii]